MRYSSLVIKPCVYNPNVNSYISGHYGIRINALTIFEILVS